MREHMGLYRGKRKDNGQWVEGCYFVQLFRDQPEERMVHKIKPIGGMGQEVDPDTIGECIGQPDKNGKLAVICNIHDNPELLKGGEGE